MKTRAAFWVLYFLFLLAAAFSGGCSLIPAPWTPNRAAAVAKAETREESARKAVLRRAQVQTEIAAVALESAPPSRPVEIARDATASASSLEAQALGPLPELDRQKTAELVTALQSENLEIRVKAESEAIRTKARDARAALDLEQARQKTEHAEAKLAAAYERERALASLVRRFVWSCIALGLLAIVAGAMAVYLKITTGGASSALSAVVSGLEKFKISTPAARGALEEALRGTMDSAHKILVRRVKVEAAP